MSRAWKPQRKDGKVSESIKHHPTSPTPTPFRPCPALPGSVQVHAHSPRAGAQRARTSDPRVRPSRHSWPGTSQSSRCAPTALSTTQRSPLPRFR
eukprot:602933-Rhodomonas_salina.1